MTAGAHNNCGTLSAGNRRDQKTARLHINIPAKPIRIEALAFLDQVSAPLTPRQIERALRDHGISKSQRTVMASALWRLNIIAVTPRENET